MKQVLQNLKTGVLEVQDVPPPAIRPGHLLIQTRSSLVSAGTERMLISFAKSSLLGKARQQPEKFRQAIDKIKTDGLLPTLQSISSRLDEPLPLGYCNCGEVLGVGENVDGFEVGDRVANNGPHAEVVCVPKHLCAKVPDCVSDEQAAFTVLASIGLQGVRLLKPTFGETIVVYGLGLLGLLTVQILKNCGCKILGVDIKKPRLELAKKFGADIVDVSGAADPVAAATAYSGGKGVDGVLITAAAKDDSIVHQSAQMSRKHGRIVLVGVVDLNLRRADFYEKELSFQVSCSYGPGRYDLDYEQKGQDYPYGLVRWTEQRNFEAVLESMAAGALKTDSLVSERIAQAQANKAYQMLTDDSGKLGLILTYPAGKADLDSVLVMPKARRARAKAESVVAGVIGAGNFAKITMLPALKKLNVRLKTVADINGTAASHAAGKFGFELASNDYQAILKDPDINVVFITTRHDLHAKMVIEALQAGKHIHVEKPLCLNRQELAMIEDAYDKAGDRQLLVGLNRRFSPHAEKIHSLVKSRSAPLCMNWLVNAGYIPPDAWVQDRHIGGGRVIGEGCHWIDFMAYLAQAPVVSVAAQMAGDVPGVEVRDDKMTASFGFADGSIGTLNYFANGHKSYSKETLTVFCESKVLHLDNFRKLKGYGWKGFGKMNLINQDKGHKAQFHCFIENLARGGEAVIPFSEIKNITLASFAAVESAGAGKLLKIQ